MKKTKIAVIGLGFVGGSIYQSLQREEPFIKVVGIDPAKGYATPLKDIAEFDAVFVCVPSPQNEDGTADTSILEQVLADLTAVNFTGVIISKVTAPPGVYQRLATIYPNLVHVPEFLTAANAYDDYVKGKFAIIGGSIIAYRNEAERIVKLSQHQLEHVEHCSIVEASLAKYAINSFLATKVVFMNEMAALTEASGGDWKIVSSLIKHDARLGNSHMQVPGPDGQFGFGGHCFPKDTAAILKHAEELGKNLSVLDTAVKKNLIIRLSDK